jgi:energy-coupling factor transporter ATP-binding protein EcfA2
MQPRTLQEYHVFLASPSDTDEQRQAVRDFFADFNRQIGSFRGVQFTVIDWENYSSIGVGRPQELITSATLQRFSESLVLVIGILAQRFGSPTGTHDSGTIEEFEWAKDRHKLGGFPEIKWFFKKIEQFQAPSDPERIQEALDQWRDVLAFRERLRSETPPVFYGEFGDAIDFQSVLRNDLMLWLNDSSRPWNDVGASEQNIPAVVAVPQDYYRKLANEFQWLDISGIDNDRAFSIPLDKVYVRLRVALSEEVSTIDKEPASGEGVVIDIQSALERFRKLVIVGDPGSGKSTFLKFIALMIARSQVEGNPSLATSRLNLQSPLPIPLFISLWELADYVRTAKEALAEPIVSFAQSQLGGLTADQIERLLSAGSFCVLLDGLDEVPTEIGRAKISRIVEAFVQKFQTNRFVITSRVRAYTGDTILRGDFSRCDIQEFDQADRSEFLKSWFSLLFKVSTQTAFSPGTEAYVAHENLIDSIESKDRIRALAVNPLLLTVIAIVHWNRKRPPIATGRFVRRMR